MRVEGRSRRGASIVTYGLAVGLVALGVSLAVSRTGEQVSGLTARVAGSVNAVDGAISGNKGPSYQGSALSDQAIEQFDAIASIDARGFVDPEGDRLDYSLSLTGGLRSGDFTVQEFADGAVVDGTPSGSGTLAVVATDPIGRKATAGPIEIVVDPNAAPVIGGVPAAVTVTEGASLSLTYTAVTDDETDALTPSATGVAGAAAARAGTDVTVTSDPLGPGAFDVALSVTDAHGARTDAPLVSATVLPRSCESLLASDAGASTGVHTIDPDGPGGDAPIQAYCDMDRDGGGWTLIATIADDQQNYWIESNRANLWNGNVHGSVTQARSADMQSRAWSTLAADQLLLRHGQNEAKFLRFDNVLSNQPMASRYTGTNTVIGTFFPQRIDGSWWRQCGDLGMRLQTPDSDPHHNWDSAGFGFVFKSNQNDGCDWDDALGNFHEGMHDDEEWASSGQKDFFYNRNFAGSAMMVFVR